MPRARPVFQIHHHLAQWQTMESRVTVAGFQPWFSHCRAGPVQINWPLRLLTPSNVKWGRWYHSQSCHVIQMVLTPAPDVLLLILTTLLSGQWQWTQKRWFTNVKLRFSLLVGMGLFPSICGPASLFSPSLIQLVDYLSHMRHFTYIINLYNNFNR